MRTILFAMTLMWGSLTYADIKVSDVEVFSGYPWKEVVVGYTITGIDADANAIRLTATDKSANKSYTTCVYSVDKWSEGHHVLRWNAAAEGVKFSSSNVVFSVSVLEVGVRLWEDGPYWAECNVGATKPDEYGYYFWWGDTVGYKRNAANNGWVSVKDGSVFSFKRGNCPTFGKGNLQLISDGYIKSGKLVAALDAATAHLGVPWRMPTDEELSALINNCTTTWTTLNGVYGRLVTGKGAYSSKSIFLPAAGSGCGTDLNAIGSGGGTTGHPRRTRAIPTTRGASTSIRAISLGTTTGTPGATGILFVLSEDLPNSARIARASDSFLFM